MALVLLLGAGLLLRSVQKLLAVRMGLNPARILTVRLPLWSERYRAEEQRIAFVGELLSRTRSLSSVEHALHFHQNAKCEPPFTTAGGHFNPTNMPHGAPDAQSHHAGDFGNVTADDKGEVHTTVTSHMLTVDAGPNSVVGHAVIVHANPDDLTTQPSGNAGPRIACGVVEAHSMANMH